MWAERPSLAEVLALRREGHGSIHREQATRQPSPPSLVRSWPGVVGAGPQVVARRARGSLTGRRPAGNVSQTTGEVVVHRRRPRGTASQKLERRPGIHPSGHDGLLYPCKSQGEARERWPRSGIEDRRSSSPHSFGYSVWGASSSSSNSSATTSSTRPKGSARTRSPRCASSTWT